jgi:Cd2+/Zn2+-exporting ATPase
MSDHPTSASAPFRLRIAGMDCGACAKIIEQGIGRLEGVDDVRVSFATEIMEGSGDVSLDALRRRVEELGYGIGEDRAQETAPAARGLRGFLEFLWGEPRSRLALLLGVAALAMLPVYLGSSSAALTTLTELLALTAIAVVGYPIAANGIRSLLFTRRITIDLLIATAAVGAVAIGAAGEAAAVVLLYRLGEALEAYSAARSRASLRGLLTLKPETATVIREEAGAQPATLTLPVDRLAPGHRVLVKPGERVPADGTVVRGASAVDAAAITGESIPVPRAEGDEIFAGTINGEGTLEIAVSRRAEDFTISQIARLVEQAQTRRSPAERVVDRFARWYTPAVVLVAIAVATAPPLLLGQPLLGTAAGNPGWLYRGLALLIVACPCALVISIPVTVVSALARLAQIGILVKGGAQLDALAGVSVFAFDKTGTLTRGRPAVSGVRSRECEHESDSAEACAPCDDVVAIAASVESGSEHPFAHAVLTAAADRRLESRYLPAAEITAHAGRGVSGKLSGRRVTVGHPALFDVPRPGGDADATLHALLSEADTAGRSLMLVAEDDRVLGYIQVEDQPRDSSRRALSELRTIDPAYRFVMLTGDRRAVAEDIARRLGHMDEIHAELMPAEKLAAVEALQRKQEHVAMVGDGINDAPALAAARLGIAMGGAGSHQAMEIADIVLMQDDLSHLPVAVSIARKTQKLVKENIALSLGLKLAVLALAVPGLATLWMAVLADVGTTVLVTLNGMRMLRANGASSPGS